MTEYNIKETYEPGSLDEVVGELEIPNQYVSLKARKDYRKLVRWGKEAIIDNVLGFLIGIAAGSLDEKIDMYQKNDFNQVSDAFSLLGYGTFTLYLVKKRNLDLTRSLGLPGMFFGALLGQYLIRKYT